MRTWQILGFSALSFVLLGCATVDVVHLVGPDNQTVQCGPEYFHFAAWIEGNQETREELRSKCIADYERQGYRQVPASSAAQTSQSATN